MRIIEAIPIKDFKYKIQLTKYYDQRRSEYKRIEVIGNILYLERNERRNGKRSAV